MSNKNINGVEIAYEYLGDKDHPVVLLIHGLGQPLTSWPVGFVDTLLAQNFSVLLVDNRDIGQSQKFSDLGVPKLGRQILKAKLGLTVTPPYELKAMMQDIDGLLDALNIASVHVVGASMGGMIAQLLAIYSPDKCRTLTSIMSHTGNRSLRGPKLKVLRHILSRPDSWSFEDRMTFNIKIWRLIASPQFPSSGEYWREFVATNMLRGIDPTGTARQMSAILSAPCRDEALAKLTVPTLVIHGADDPMVPVKGGRQTAAAINGSQLEIINGMGHDVPEQLFERLGALIGQHVTKAEAGVK